jgi:hypothetical protein
MGLALVRIRILGGAPTPGTRAVRSPALHGTTTTQGMRPTQAWRKRINWCSSVTIGPACIKNVENYVLSCDACARLKTGRAITVPIGSLPEAQEPGKVASNITGPYIDHIRNERGAYPSQPRGDDGSRRSRVANLQVARSVWQIIHRTEAEIYVRVIEGIVSITRSRQNIHYSLAIAV